MATAAPDANYQADLTIAGKHGTVLTTEGIQMRKYVGGRFGQKVVNGYEISIYVNPVVTK